MKRLIGLHSVFLIFVFLTIVSAEEAIQNSEVTSGLSRAKSLYATQKYQEALKAYKEANKRAHNQCLECYLGMAATSVVIGDLSRGLEDCDKALAVAQNDPDRARIHGLKGDVLARIALQDHKKIGDAEAEFRTALQLNPKEVFDHMQLGIMLLRESHDPEGIKELNAFVMAVPYGKQHDLAMKIIANPRRARENYAPDFEITTIEGTKLSLTDLAGKVVVLDFWATWCPPCVSSVPELKELVKKYPQDRMVLLSVSADHDEAAWQSFIAKQKMSWNQFLDSESEMRDIFDVHNFPTYIVIDSEGIIRERIVGLNPQQSISSRLKSVLQGIPQLNAKR